MRTGGSISLFISMIFLLVMSVITMTIRSAISQAAAVTVSTGATLSIDSVFAEYNKALFDKYGILLFDGASDGNEPDADIIASKIDTYLKYNVSPVNGPNKAVLKDLLGIEASVTVNKIVTPMYGGGMLWQDMAVDFEKYAKPIDLAAKYLDLNDKNEEADTAQKINTKVNSCTREAMLIDRAAASLVTYVDGIKVDKKGIDFSKLGLNKAFIKKLTYEKPTIQNMYISNQNVFNKVTPGTLCFQTIRDKVEQAVKKKDDKEIKSIIKLFKDTFLDCAKSLDSAISIVDQIKKSMSALDKHIDDTNQYFNSESPSLTEEIRISLKEEVSALNNYRKVIAGDISDVDEVGKSLKKLKEIYDKISDRVKNISGAANVVTKELEKIDNDLKNIDFAGLSFNYSKLKQCEYDEDFLDRIQQFLDEGLLTFVIPSGQKVSGYEIKDYDTKISSLCDNSEAKKYLKERSKSVTASKKIVYTEYVMDKFKSFVDVKAGMPPDAMLNYEIEYILYGKNSDKQNLAEMTKELALIRSGFNMLYIMTDSEKKEEAYTWAVSLVGATGIEPLVKLVQYTIMYLWSYAEGIFDVRILLGKGKVPIKKTAEDWKTSLSGLLSESLEGDDSKSDKGLDYKAYLRFLLYLKNDGKKAAYTMDIVDMYMISSVDKSFSLSRYVYAVETDITYTMKGLKKSKTYRCAQTY